MRTKIPTTKPVPANYMGVWQRELLETATHKDDSSLVLWMQTQHYHIDIRIPATRANMRSVAELAEYNNDELLILASQQGFAGVTVVTPSTSSSSDVCQWLREIDFQPPTGARDIGKMVFSDANTLIETGLDDTYLEVWRCLAHSNESCVFSDVSSKNRHGAEVPTYCMQAGKYVSHARPRSVNLPKAPTLLSLIESNKPARELLLDWLDMEISFGEILDAKCWQIKHSTLPFKQGLIMPLPN